MLTVKAQALVDITVEVAGFETTIDEADVSQAVQDEIGHTGAVVIGIESWTAEVDE